MSDVTQILSQIDAGNPQAAEQLLPLVYDELRKLAAARLAHEKPGQTLQATALVHEAYLRLVARPDGEKERQRDGETEQAEHPSIAPSLSPSVTPSLRPSVPAFHSRGHFFAAAAEAMRRILIDGARRKQSLKQGGDGARVELDEGQIATGERPFDLLDLDDALAALERHDATAAHLVKLRYFAGFGHQEAADALGIGRREADRLWALARAWLYQLLGDANA
jgi:DNA-directed RNA polymerase specialized sigma24 family protein